MLSLDATGPTYKVKPHFTALQPGLESPISVRVPGWASQRVRHCQSVKYFIYEKNGLLKHEVKP